MATLYLVATPIGNLKDITLRALDTLKAVDVILCEDTRTTLKLLGKYGIKKRLMVHENHNETESAEGIIKLLNDGKNLAIVSESGTPIISDPGFTVVRKIKETTEHNVVSIPGASAITTALTASGLPPYPFTFIGFLPKTVKFHKVLDKYIARKETFLFFESPRRIKSVLDYIAQKYPIASVCIARELTKIHEQIVTKKATEIAQLLGNEIPLKGEFTVVVLSE
ncbi:16S rRNA (cytidine(1402)-2'-O)-methyltransferase [Candidatus Dojkabacteria bacterium]|nr:16S rRNA (cytidine(1402)-2'-O)-methyltransferase [Candidatus Dojkabacteria bacterium]